MFFRVNMLVHNGGRASEIFFVMENDYKSLKSLEEDMARTGLIRGIRYETEKAGYRARRAVDAYETIVNVDAIVSISDMVEELIGTDGTVLFGHDGSGEEE